LQALHGPAGLYIGSKTPAEIALSIMAEVVAVKNGLQQPAPTPVQAGKSQQDNAGTPTADPATPATQTAAAATASSCAF
jgi:xanthine dehydrogenase accessory factor